VGGVERGAIGFATQDIERTGPIVNPPIRGQTGVTLIVEGIDVFYGAAQALRGVSLSAPPGEVTCVLGRNGAGKTTLLRAIAGHQQISAGKITWEGENISALPPFKRAAAGMAIVPQGREIFPLLTVEENLKTGFAPLSRSQHSLPQEIFDLFPILKTMLNRRGGDLSGGQQQQLAIARAIVMRPRLLILDEPTEGIQPSIIKDIGRAISFLREKGDMAIILVEQYFDFARDLGNSFAVLERGSVVMSGNRTQLQAPDVRQRLIV
jgi:urea transport system ATP-binding protein